MTSNNTAESGTFDVFMCHNSGDKIEIRRLTDELIKQGIRPWLDEREITPGSLWQSALEEQIGNIKSAAIFIGASGIGPWQNMEIRSFINEFVERQCPVIPVFLTTVSATPNLPILLKNFHAVDFRKPSPDPLQQLVWGIKGERQQLTQLFESTTYGKPLPSAQGQDYRIYSPIAEQPAQEQRAQLYILLNRVKEFWIDGVLNSSLQNNALISLGKDVADTAVEIQFNRIIDVPKHDNQFGNDTAIDKIFDATGLLIILGEPGCGKTTTLLELADSLIKRAINDPKERIPVIFNLSTWKKGQLLIDWMVEALTKIYNIPAKVALLWFDKGYLVPLLDGLDEVRAEFQADCVTAINTFIENKQPPGLAVCCRLQDYQWLPERLKMNGAIAIKPLNRDQLDHFFSSAGAEMQWLKSALDTDPVLHELAQSPFMLNIMGAAYQTDKRKILSDQGLTLENRRTEIFDAYVDKVFSHKDIKEAAASRSETLTWLNWLALNMSEHSQSIFFIENLQPTWLDNWKQTIAYREVATLIFGLVVAVTCLLLAKFENIVVTESISLSLYYFLVVLLLGLFVKFNSAIINGLLCGLGFSAVGMLELGVTKISDWMPFGLFAALIGGIGIGSLNTIKTVETMSWSWREFMFKALKGFGVGACISGLVGGLLYGYAQGMKNGLLFGLFIGLLLGLLIGLLYGIIKGFSDRVSDLKTAPNQGIRLTLKNGVLTFLMSFFVIGLITWLIYSARGFTLESFVSGTIIGLSNGLIIGFNRGLATVIKHYSLRLVLFGAKKIPLKFIPFLDYCANLILLKKVGGGYIFIHRMLQEYFANLTLK